MKDAPSSEKPERKRPGPPVWGATEGLATTQSAGRVMTN
jgi:hypothetical protein